MPVSDTGNEYEVNAPIAKQAQLQVVPAAMAPSRERKDPRSRQQAQEAKFESDARSEPDRSHVAVPAAVMAKESAKPEPQKEASDDTQPQEHAQMAPAPVPYEEKERDPSPKPQQMFEELSNSRNPAQHYGQEQGSITQETMVGEFVFREDDAERTITFTQAPLGMKFDKHKMPIVIRAFTKNSYAQMAGVRPGMELIRVEGTDISSLSYEEAFAIITAAARRISDRGTASSSSKGIASSLLSKLPTK